MNNAFGQFSDEALALFHEAYAEQSKELKKACWKGYEAVGTKNKNGKQVPNCVPVKKKRKSK